MACHACYSPSPKIIEESNIKYIEKLEQKIDFLTMFLCSICKYMEENKIPLIGIVSNCDFSNDIMRWYKEHQKHDNHYKKTEKVEKLKFLEWKKGICENLLKEYENEIKEL